MREASSQQVWVDEKEVNECQLCDSPFSVARRKVCVCVCVCECVCVCVCVCV